ncbi:MAG: DUF2147 domain-containing protein [Methylovirgula sp.]|jgi:uncharacterized protein (DUF2147 family)
MKTSALVAAASLLACVPAASASPGPVGEWLIADGSADVAIRPCGANLCGFVSWSKDAANLVGREVLIDMRPVGDLWSGTVVNAQDGQRYDARMMLVSDGVLKIEGCVLGGIFCGDQQWSRVK